MSNEKYTIGYANAIIAMFMDFDIVYVGYADSEEESLWQRNHEEWMNKVGLTQVGRYIVNVETNIWHHWYDMKYHSSWDWLRPVWDKFRDLKFTEETSMKLHLNYVARLAQDIAYGTIDEFHHNIHIAIQWYNKQSEAKGMPDLTMEYRGPNAHCKACEDEKKGIKHIQAQRHTCRK